MRVTVLLGGPSAEREVSLVSGAAVARGLREAGHEVFEGDVSPADLTSLDRPADVVFPVLHGEFGESGELQEILEKRGVAFVGSGSVASRVGIDKAVTKKAWEGAGLPTPPYALVERGGAGQDRGEGLLSKACVVKALAQGSSIDVHVFKTDEAARTGARKVFGEILARDGRVLVEKFVRGPELTVGLLEERALPPIRIVPMAEFFDYEAKYKRSDTEHRFDTGLPEAVVERCKRLAESANAVVGAVDLARIDVMLDEGEGLAPYLLEINTLPGFTPKSLLPEAAAHTGIGFAALVDRLVKRAAARGPRG